ncbi:MAG: phospho-N-acetylmuramoyl-pentapeptide-transferase, partial [Elusimicrobia bacterium]|nr:phospho-N-acetylmuramoyl-pentapeptide-transferase [Elusimicrobiota bacterium]
MLYWLYSLRGSWGPLNIFRYISVRAGGAALTALVFSLLLGPRLIRWLRAKKIGQEQRTDGPKSHLSKAGTPTMGGVLIVSAVAFSTLLWMRLDSRFTWILLFVSAALTAIGLWDDWLKLVRKDPRGAPSRAKFAVQILAALVVVTLLAVDPPCPERATALLLPYFPDKYVELGSLYYVLAVLLFVGSSNAVNLTDGLDGLAAGCSIFCAIAYGVFAYMAGHAKFSAYLLLPHVAGAGEITVFLGGLIGACLGFLWFNSYPAEMFMGDTSSLFLGGAIGTVALLVKQELLLPIVGGVFVAETLSVILQMGSYKLRKGKRVLRMAPLHHHFELGGIAESKVTVRFWIVAIVLMLAALASLK